MCAMKQSLKLWNILLMLCIPIFAISSDDEGPKYLNERMELVKSKKQATYYAEMVGKVDGKYQVKVHFLDGTVKMEGTYQDPEMKVAHGEFTYYYSSGKVESNGLFHEGYKYGIWQRFLEDGTERPEKVYAAGAMLKYMNAEAQR